MGFAKLIEISRKKNTRKKHNPISDLLEDIEDRM